MLDFEKIQKQAVGIARHEHAHRQKTPKSQELCATAFSLEDYVAPASKRPVRAWAELAAPFITFEEWQSIVEHVDGTVEGFDGDVIRFFETAFEGLELKCGARVWA